MMAWVPRFQCSSPENPESWPAPWVPQHLQTQTFEGPSPRQTQYHVWNKDFEGPWIADFCFILYSTGTVHDISDIIHHFQHQSRRSPIRMLIFWPNGWVERLGLHLGSIDEVVEEFLSGAGLSAGLIPSLAGWVGWEGAALGILLLLLGRLEVGLMGSLQGEIRPVPSGPDKPEIHYFHGKITSNWGIFQQSMFHCRRVCVLVVLLFQKPASRVLRGMFMSLHSASPDS